MKLISTILSRLIAWFKGGEAEEAIRQAHASVEKPETHLSTTPW